MREANGKNGLAYMHPMTENMSDKAVTIGEGQRIIHDILIKQVHSDV